MDINIKHRPQAPWCAAQANAEGWCIVCNVDYDDNRIVRKTTRIVCMASQDDADETMLSMVLDKAMEGSEYHKHALSMLGVEIMEWARDANAPGGWARTRRTFTSSINGYVSELPL